jgi:signal transduction histidine kinase/DNA-binding response OmpR family regulator
MRTVSRPEIVLIALGSAIIVAVLLAFGYTACSQYEAALENARRSTLGFANIVGEHTARSFEAADRTLREVELMRGDYFDGKYADARALKDALQLLQRTSPLIVALGWTDASGDVVAHSYERDPPRPSIATMEHFVVHKNGTESSLFVSAPFVSVATGRWFSAISRRMNNPDGSFAGVATAPLDLSYFSHIYRALDLGAQGTVVLLHHESHMIMAREPPRPDLMGTSFAGRSPELGQRLRDASVGAYWVTSILNGQERLVAYKAVTGSPLVVLVAMAKEDILQPWRAQMIVSGSIIALLVAVIVIGIAVVLKQSRKLGEQTGLLSAALDNMDQGLITVSKDDSIVLYNRRAAELLDLPLDLLARRPSSVEVLTYQASTGEFDNAPDELKSLMKSRIEPGAPAFYERIRPNGTALEVRTVPFADGGVVRTYTDVTARLAVKDALRKEKEHAEAATRAKSEFLATMSHELRTPLTAIIGVAELLMTGEPSADRRQQLLAMQREAGRGLLQVVNDILDHAKIEAGGLDIEKAPFDLAGLVEGCIGLFRPTTDEKRLRLDLDIDPLVPEVVIGDPMRLRQVLTNLLSNAVKFTERGFVRLSVRTSTADVDGFCFKVIDTGIGIDRRRLPHLFERFTQGDSSTARRYGGTGLGLAISRDLVLLMGGVLVAESQPGAGSLFSFTIPLCPDASRQELVKPSAKAAAHARVLLVEDSAIVREVVLAMLQQAGHSVSCASSGRQAVALAAEERFDIILMDIQMPGIDGYAAARLIAKTTGPSQASPIVALTANAAPEDIQRSFAAGMKAHLAKPVDWTELNATISELVHREGRQLHATGVPETNPKLEELERKIGTTSTARLLQLFVEEARAFLADHDDDGVSSLSLAALAHTFAGSAGMLGFEELYAACRDLEATARDDQPFAGAVACCRDERDRAMEIAAAWLIQLSVSLEERSA